MSDESLTKMLGGLPSGVQIALMSLVDAVIGLSHDEKEFARGALGVLRELAGDNISDADQRQQVERLLKALQTLIRRADHAAEGLPDTVDALRRALDDGHPAAESPPGVSG